MDHAIAHHSGDHYLPQATDAAAARAEGLPGCWKLGAGRALTLHARQAGVLRIAHGRVWVTFNNADDLRVRAGDYFLSRGESLSLLPGESLVMESFSIGYTPSAYFSWEPAQAARTEAASHANVAQPLRDLRLASGLATRAVGRLGRALASGALRLVVRAAEPLATGVAISFVASRARCTAPERSFQAQACDHCVPG